MRIRHTSAALLTLALAVGCIEEEGGGPIGGDGGAGGESGGAGGQVGGSGGDIGGSGGTGGAGGQVGGSGGTGGIGGSGGAGGQVGGSGGTGGAGGQIGGSGGSGGTGGVGGGLPEPAIHRPSPVTCDDERPVNPIDVSEWGEGPDIECESHDECDDGRNGRCVYTRFGTACTYDQCLEDSACGGTVCQCEGGFYADNNICLSEGNCLVDADCGDGGYCSPSFGDCGSYTGVVGWYCHTAEDECTDNADCGGDEGGFGDYCAYMPATGRWQCSNSHCAGK